MTIRLTNSIFRAMRECPARAMAQYGAIIRGDKEPPRYTQETTTAMAAGSLVDAIVTGGFKTFAADAVQTEQLIADKVFKSPYDPIGAATAEALTLKRGGWNQAAKDAIYAAYRLLSDPDAITIIGNSKKQVSVETEIADGVYWHGTIDLLWERPDGSAVVVDLKSPGRAEPGWIVAGGKNVLVPWWQTWAYWFQLAGYANAIQRSRRYSEVHSGILYATRETPSAIGFIPLPDMVAVWKEIVEATLPMIQPIVSGVVEPPKCGNCDYCRSVSRVEVPAEWPVMLGAETVVIPDLYQN